MKTNVRISQKTLRLTTIGILTAIMLIMAFTPLGYIKAGIIEITLYTIPVAIGAILFGPVGGFYLGTLFGLTSFVQCFGMSGFGTMLFSVNPVFTLILCMIPRMLMGYFTGLIYKVMESRCTKTFVNYLLSAFAAPFLNTLLFVGTLVLLFYNTSEIQGIAAELGASNVFMFVILFAGINCLVEMAATMLVATPIARLFAKICDRI